MWVDECYLKQKITHCIENYAVLSHAHPRYARTNLYETAHIGDHKGITLVVQLFQIRQVGMDPHHVAWLRARRDFNLMKLVLRNSEIRSAHVCVFFV